MSSTSARCRYNVNIISHWLSPYPERSLNTTHKLCAIFTFCCVKWCVGKVIFTCFTHNILQGYFNGPGVIMIVPFQARKLNFFGTRQNWAVSYIDYTKFHLPRPVLHSPGHIFTHIGERASASFPACILSEATSNNTDKYFTGTHHELYNMTRNKTNPCVYLMGYTALPNHYLNQWWPTINIDVEEESNYTQRNCWGVYWFHSVRPSVHSSVQHPVSAL